MLPTTLALSTPLTYEQQYQQASRHAAINARAFQAARRIFDFFESHHQLIKKETARHKQAYFFKAQDAVLKLDDPDTREEAQLVLDFFALSGVAQLPVFYSRTPHREKKTALIASQLHQRVFSLHTLSLNPKLKEALLQKLPQEAHFILTLSDADIFLTPSLSLEEELLYRRFASIDWCYKQPNNEQLFQSDFQTLHLHFLAGEVEIESIRPNSQTIPFSSDKVRDLFSRDWQILASCLFREEDAAKVTHFSIQPLIEDMIVLANEPRPEKIDSLLHHLTPEAEYAAILSGEIQTLDLHGANIGITNVDSPAYRRFQSTRFERVETQGWIGFELSFMDLKCFFYTFHDREQALNISVSYQENGRLICGTLRELKELLKAIEERSELVFFDTELSIGESSYLQAIFYKNRPHVLIPLRSAFLQFSWSQKPLQQATIDKLLSDSNRLPLLEKWMQKEDNCLYQRMSADEINAIKAWIAPLLQRLSLSRAKEEREELTPPTTALKKQFTQDILAQGEDRPEWEILKKHFPPSLGKNYSEKEKQKIAAAIFPRLTERQQTALRMRIERRNEYLSCYINLKNSSAEGLPLAQELTTFLARPSCPLFSYVKESLQERIALIVKTKDLTPLLLVKNEICTLSTPSFFALQAAMYPLLADAFYLSYRLAKEALREPNGRFSSFAQELYLAGGSIGFYDYSLDQQIQVAEKQLARSLSVTKTCRALNKAISELSKEEISFFMEIGTIPSSS